MISLEEPDLWKAEHEAGGLPTQSWSYAWALSASDVKPKLAVVLSGGARMLMPYFERDWMNTTDIATILGLSGASISHGSNRPLSLWREFAAQQGWVAGYIQLAPSADLREPPAEDELVTSNAVFLLDIRAGDVLDSASTMIRRKVRKAERLGVTLVDDRVELSEAMRRLYPATLRRVGRPIGLRRVCSHPRALGV